MRDIYALPDIGLTTSAGRGGISIPVAGTLATSHFAMYWTIFIILLLAINSPAVAQSSFLNSSARATKVTMSIYPEVGLTPLATFRAEQIHGDYQKRGFFRIGVLPMVVLEELSLELRDTNQLSAALTRANIHFGSRNKSSEVLEGRNFSLSFTGQTNGVLHARTIQLGSRAEWVLHEGTISQRDMPPIPFRRATLTIAGPKAGELTYDAPNGQIRVPLLSLAGDKSHEFTKP